MRQAALAGWYDPRLVLLSILMAVLGAHAGLTLAGRAVAHGEHRRPAWIAGGAVALAVGIWAMHYTAMVAHRLPVPVLYHWPTALLSYLPGLLGSLVGLFLVVDGTPRRRVVAASVAVGAGIVGMHYAAMASMRLPAERHHSAALVALSAVPAVALSLPSLWSASWHRRPSRSVGWQRPAATLLMGAAICTMHYIGMAAVTFRPAAMPELSHAVHVTTLGVAGAAIVSILVLSVAPLASTLDRLHKNSEQLRALGARAHRVREEERARVAREIHDELGQALTSIKLDVAALSHDLPPEQAARAESVKGLVDDTIRAVRRIATDLRPGVLDDLGLAAAVEWAAEEFTARTGIPCEVRLPDEDLAVDPEAAIALFRILQEALTNVARHARASRVSVTLAADGDALSLEVRDDGVGVDRDRIGARRSLGILGMEERAALLGGELTVQRGPGLGTAVHARLPRTVGAAAP